MNNTFKNYNLKDTIAAIATFPSRSALGVIKISGKKALPVISRVFAAKRKKDLRKVPTYTLHYGWIIEPRAKKKRIIDEVLVSVMRAPHSYTCEDVIEISSHGGVMAVNKILEIILKQGCRLAFPGEFTYRALMNGRIDLLQAESVSSVVSARSEEGLKLASAQLFGEAGKKIEELKEEIKGLFVQTEAWINFPEDEINADVKSFSAQVSDIEKKVERFLSGSDEARILKEGLKCVICGRTNAGKSTLFNRLLRQDRVIVSEHAGTTRDVIEETINIKGVPLRIFDTAGILEPKDLITKKALEKSAHMFDQADLVIVVFDGSRSLGRDDYFFLKKVKDKNTIFVINKTDLRQKIEIKKITSDTRHLVQLSCATHKGLKDLEDAIFHTVYQQGVHREDMIFLNQYQQQELREVKKNLVQAKEYLDKKYSIDFVNFSLKSSLESIGRLTGEVFSREILESIFSQFCIGK